MTAPDISIIILTWNTATVTLGNVNQLQKKLKNINYEIIVIDNGSTDNTIDLFQQKKGVIYFRNANNLGFSKGNNSGCHLASGKYLFFLNSDMTYISGLDKMVSFIKKNPDVGIVGPKFLNPDLTTQGSVFPPQTLINAIKQFWFNQQTFSKYFPQDSLPAQVWSVSGGALLIKKDLFYKIGKWNEKYYFYYEDLDICRQVRESGLKIVYYPQCRFIHHHGVTTRLLTSSDSAFSRLVRSSKIYHGLFNHYLINFVIWSGQKLRRLF